MLRVGVVKEIKPFESRVGMTPDGVGALVRLGHDVYLQAGSGEGCGYPDKEYREAGARILKDPAVVWKAASIIVKVKEPQAKEYVYFRPGQFIFTFFHLATDKRLAEALVKSRATAIAYEMVQDDDGSLPILAPMSQAAGKLAVQVGGSLLTKPAGGKGILLGGVGEYGRGRVVVLGTGNVGIAAMERAVALGAEVSMFGRDENRMARLRAAHPGRVQVEPLTAGRIAAQLPTADLLIGAVSVPGARAPIVVPRNAVSRMTAGSVIVDVAIDQGGCIATSKPTTHAKPTYVANGVIHYAVTNMPAAVPRTSSMGLAAKTMPFLQKMAALGIENAIRIDPALVRGVVAADGMIRNENVARAHRMRWKPWP